MTQHCCLESRGCDALIELLSLLLPDGGPTQSVLGCHTHKERRRMLLSRPGPTAALLLLGLHHARVGHHHYRIIANIMPGLTFVLKEVDF